MPASRFNRPKPSCAASVFRYIRISGNIRKDWGSGMDEKRVGRPPKADAEKRQQIGVRTSADLKARLERAAAANGRSVAQEAELRLIQSFENDDLLGPTNRSTFIRMAAQIARAEAATGKSWLTDLTTYCAAGLLMDRVRRQSRPLPGGLPVEPSEYHKAVDAEYEFTALKAVLARYKVVRSTLAGMFGDQHDFATNPESEWEGVNGPADETEREILREQLDELMTLKSDIDSHRDNLGAMQRAIDSAAEEGGRLAARLIIAESSDGA
jgi:hypothetical protein